MYHTQMHAHLSRTKGIPVARQVRTLECHALLQLLINVVVDVIVVTLVLLQLYELA
jgi:hypothetical protein